MWRIAIIVLAGVAASCSRSDPERELRSTVSAMAQAIEQREPAAFLDSVSDDFARESGAFGKQDAKRVLLATYLRNEKITVSAVVSSVRSRRRSRACESARDRHRWRGAFTRAWTGMGF